MIPLAEVLLRVGRDAGQSGIGMVHISIIEPDPNTFRHQYYYNARQNKLYMRIRRHDGFYFWKQINLTSFAQHSALTQ